MHRNQVLPVACCSDPDDDQVEVVKTNYDLVKVVQQLPPVPCTTSNSLLRSIDPWPTSNNVVRMINNLVYIKEQLPDCFPEHKRQFDHKAGLQTCCICKVVSFGADSWR